eukprot:7378209-Prymnesium_polylepis.1
MSLPRAILVSASPGSPGACRLSQHRPYQAAPPRRARRPRARRVSAAGSCPMAAVAPQPRLR